MPLLIDDYLRTEKIDGTIYNMSPSGDFIHSQINGNLYHAIRQQLKDSICVVAVKNLDLYLSVDEYWIISPRERSVEVYYLEEGKYNLVGSHILVEDEEDENYNAALPLTLKALPTVSIIFQDIFENIE